jgi:hypothetical protein
MLCPKCQLEQPDGGLECVRCGIVFSRWEELHVAGGNVYRPLPAAVTVAAEEPKGLEPWKELLLPADDREVEPVYFWGRAALAAFLFLWGWRFLVSSVTDDYVARSFMHLINLPFHEAGHVLLSPFGEFMRVLGGTLGQLLIPAICLGTFLLRNRDPFAASAGLWWLAENFMDIAPYIADARSGSLLLLGGVTGRDVPGYHDWENILGTLSLLRYDTALGDLSYAFGRLLMLVAFAWGGCALVQQWRHLPATGITSGFERKNR